MLELARNKCESKSMTNFWRRAKPFVLGALCVMLALYLSPLSIPIGYAVSTHNITLWTKLFAPTSVFIVFAGVFVAFAFLCVTLGAAIEAYQKREALTPKFYYAALFCVIYVAGHIFYPGFNVGWPKRRAGLQQAATRAQPLIFAIEKFRLEKNRTPHSLQELVPNYLPEIPRTGMAAYPRFEYSTREEHEGRTHFKTYELQVQTSIGFINWDTFNYWPEADYPAQMYGGRVERIGAWAYVHE